MEIYRCRRCKYTSAVKRFRCRRCKAVQPWERISISTAKLITFTTLYATRPGFDKPLRLGIAKTDEGVMVLARILFEEPRLGEEVALGEEEFMRSAG